MFKINHIIVSCHSLPPSPIQIHPHPHTMHASPLPGAQRLEEENALLAKRQTAFQRSRDHQDGAEEEFEAFCQKKMFRISILEQRLQRHEDTAVEKYTNLDLKLREDPRLGVLVDGETG